MTRLLISRAVSLEMPRQKSRLGTITQIRQIARALIAQGGASGEEVARSLRINRRTLDRRLQALGTTVRELLDEVRFETARDMLRQTDSGVAEIAAILGYADASVLTRAFRRWSGTTPARWRAGARARSHRAGRTKPERYSVTPRPRNVKKSQDSKPDVRSDL
jgi:AraC-like DNA-binding protein